MKPSRHKCSHKKMSNHISNPSNGFTLVEMALVLVIIGLTVTMLLQVSSGMRDAQNRLLVRSELTVVDTALANFVAQNKRLPCPADGTLASGAALAGVETLVSATGICGATAVLQTQTNGVIPYVTLGLSLSNVTDPWNTLFTYRVDPQLASNVTSLMNMTNCDPVGTAIAASNPATSVGGCITTLTTPTQVTPCISSSPVGNCTSPANFLANKGLDVWNAAINQVNNRVLGTGAAYVLISHGPNGIGAYNSNGTLQSVGSGVLGVYELPNENGKAIALPATSTTAYQDTALNDTQVVPACTPMPCVSMSLLHFDDYLSHPTILSVLNTANLGPRAN
jgi:prepilin-type N-terminal cleavage/methylation domain-containing protein